MEIYVIVPVKFPLPFCEELFRQRMERLQLQLALVVWRVEATLHHAPPWFVPHAAYGSLNCTASARVAYAACASTACAVLKQALHLHSTCLGLFSSVVANLTS